MTELFASTDAIAFSWNSSRVKSLNCMSPSALEEIINVYLHKT
jgi:hypothetical protein